MTQPYLLFQLYGPLVAWGSIAVGDRRPTFERPSRSAILGLVAAALGYKRPDPRQHEASVCEELDRQHQRLANSLHMAFRLETRGVYLQDFHTVQAPQTNNLGTRSLELRQKEIGTKVTQRDYYADQFATVCLWKHANDGPTLQEMAEALKAPTFTLYLGRKACPPALPLAPFIDTFNDPRKALDQAAARYRNHIEKLNDELKISLKQDLWSSDQGIRYFWEGNRNAGFGTPEMEQERWDEPASRSRWQFRPRIEYEGIGEPTEPASTDDPTAEP